MDARILIKHSASKCNKDLLTFLHTNVKNIRKKYNVKVIIVYSELIPKLGNSIKQLPALIMNGNVFVGNAKIKQQFVTTTAAAPTANGIQDMGCDDLQDFWNQEMHSGADEQLNEDENLMDAIKSRAMDQTTKHREQLRPSKKKRETVVSSARQDNIQLDSMNTGKISEMVGNDPMMQKFWANQESTPGFE